MRGIRAHGCCTGDRWEKPVHCGTQETQGEPMKDPIWYRLDRESGVAYEAFRMYRDMGQNRGLTQVAQALTKSRALMARWSKRYGWVARAKAYDAHIDRETNKQVEGQLIRDRAKSKTQRIRAAEALMGKCIDDLTVMVKPTDRRRNPIRLKPNEVINGLRIALEQLRKDYDDEPTERFEGELVGEAAIVNLIFPPDAQLRLSTNGQQGSNADTTGGASMDLPRNGQ